MNEKCFKCICKAKCKRTGRCKPGHCAEEWRAAKARRASAKARRSQARRSPTHTPYFSQPQPTSTATFTNL